MLDTGWGRSPRGNRLRRTYTRWMWIVLSSIVGNGWIHTGWKGYPSLLGRCCIVCGRWPSGLGMNHTLGGRWPSGLGRSHTLNGRCPSLMSRCHTLCGRWWFALMGRSYTLSGRCPSLWTPLWGIKNWVDSMLFLFNLLSYLIKPCMYAFTSHAYERRRFTLQVTYSASTLFSDELFWIVFTLEWFASYLASRCRTKWRPISMFSIGLICVSSPK